MAAVLVTLAQAKVHLKRDDNTLEDASIQFKLDQAEAIIIEYLDTSVDPLWVSPATTPGPVTAAILLVLEHLFVNRGVDMSADPELWQAVERVLVRSRNPALA